MLDGAHSERDLVDLTENLTLVGLVGLIDPPRPEARDVIARCHRAGIAVKMITGDHAVTATNIGAILSLIGAQIVGLLTMAFTTFVLFQVFNALCARSETASVFRRDTLRNGKLWTALAVVVALQAAAVHVDGVQGVFGTADFTLWDWVLTTAVASTVLWLDEARKLVPRRGA